MGRVTGNQSDQNAVPGQVRMDFGLYGEDPVRRLAMEYLERAVNDGVEQGSRIA